MIRRLHHTAWRCRDTAQTRRFYEDLLGLPLVCALEIAATKSGSAGPALHTFYRLGDGSYLAFFEAFEPPLDLRTKQAADLHIALEVEPGALPALRARAMAAGVEVHGIGDHGFLHSLRLRDPNGYVVELRTRQPEEADAMDPELNGARGVLDRWFRDRDASRAESI